MGPMWRVRWCACIDICRCVLYNACVATESEPENLQPGYIDPWLRPGYDPKLRKAKVREPFVPPRITPPQEAIAKAAELGGPGAAKAALSHEQEKESEPPKAVQLDPGVIATWERNEPAIRTFIARSLDEAGATIEACAKVVADGLKATRLYVLKSGEKVEHPDHRVRIKAAELNFQLRGFLTNASPDDMSRRGIDVGSLLKAARDRGLIQEAEVVPPLAPETREAPPGT